MFDTLIFLKGFVHMLVLFKNGKIFLKGQFEKADMLIFGRSIVKIGEISYQLLLQNKFDVDEINCENHLLIPGLVDSQTHLAGGSGEQGFLSQPPRITIEECIRGGITTTVGTIGTDTSTKTMSNLVASIKAYREAGLSSYAYAGGYELPPATVTGRIRDDILFVEEIIGLGEVAIADKRVPEPTADELAKYSIDAYVGGMLTNKAGVTRVHVGPSPRKLKTIYEMTERHDIQFEYFYFTHMDRSKELLSEGVEIAKRGSFIDLDIHERDLGSWYLYYIEQGGPPHKLSFSTDAGAIGAQELWYEIKNCVFHHKIPIERIIQHVTTVPATCLKFHRKGYFGAKQDADVLVVKEDDLEIRDVMANGKLFLRNDKFNYTDQRFTASRKADWYGLRG
jgi:beta-aspartyl-dipeptidase (metallo-type)